MISAGIEERDSQRLEFVGLAIVDPVADRARAVETLYHDEEHLRRLVTSAIGSALTTVTDPQHPLRDLIRPGDRVLIKPNWVLHRNQAPFGMDCLVTHPKLIRVVLQEVLDARPSRVVIGDAPIQGCVWDELVHPEWAQSLQDLGRQHGIPVEVKDFRRTVARQGDLIHGAETDRKAWDQYVLFDLASDSWLDPISTPEAKFRITNYDPRELEKRHGPGRHQFLLTREPFESDVILQLPKLKTHRKAGLTGALKNLVGLNGNKDFLPHHRRGGSETGGDCYPGRSRMFGFIERILDEANKSIGSLKYRVLWQVAGRLLGTYGASENGALEGSWHGNDTCWRMVLDLNRILLYGRADGTMTDIRQRRLLTLTDAIICGQGEGPLIVEPAAVGAITFGDSSPELEAVHAALFQMHPERLSLIRESFAAHARWPLAVKSMEEVQARCSGQLLTLEQIARTYGQPVRPPAGWAGHVEWEAVRC